jgi:hypothetical protein
MKMLKIFLLFIVCISIVLGCAGPGKEIKIEVGDPDAPPIGKSKD